MLFQDPPEFLIESHPGVMLLLRVDVFNCIFHLRNADAEGAIGVLPGKLLRID